MYFFFFKQKTAYEMRISDWSSDVCSSDLAPVITATRPSNLRSVTTGLLYEPLIIWFPPPTHGGEHSPTPFMPSAANGGVSRHTRPSDITSSAPLTTGPRYDRCAITGGARGERSVPRPRRWADRPDGKK